MPTLPTSILRNRNFILLWCAYTTSALGDHLSEMALLYMQDATHREDATRISAIMLFEFMLPYFLLGPAMGWLADRLPRKRVMIAADLVRMAFMFSFAGIFSLIFDTFAGKDWPEHLTSTTGFPLLSPWLYAAPLLFTGVFAAMFSPARAAMLPTLIRNDQIIRGNGLMNAMGPIASIASFLIGAALIEAYAGQAPRISFLADGATFLASAALLCFIFPPARRSRSIEPSKQKRTLMDGFRYCRAHRRVIELISFTVIFWSAAAAIRSVIPALVGHAGGQVSDIAYFNAALGIGMLFGAFVVALLGDALKSEIAISWSFIGAGLSVFALAAGWFLVTPPSAPIALGPGRGFAGNYVALFLTGAFGSGVLVSTNALLQKVVPDVFRGRVFGVRDVAAMGGLLMATGWLAIPPWKTIDRYVPLLLALVAGAMLAAGIITVIMRLKRGRFSVAANFWINGNYFYCWLWQRARRVGICTVPVEGAAIIAANHNSTLDPFVLAAGLPNRAPSFMIAKEYTRIPVFRWLTESIECVPVNRSGEDVASVKAALRHLKAGKLLVIFPQGRIQHPDEPVELQDGLAMLALRSGAPVIPAYVSGIKYRNAIVTPFLMRHHSAVRFGPPVDLSKWKGREKDRSAYHDVVQHVMHDIVALKPIDDAS
jgi:1-acyl-sn-glycerol-3-phosphate acyltransferase